MLPSLDTSIHGLALTAGLGIIPAMADVIRDYACDNKTSSKLQYIVWNIVKVDFSTIFHFIAVGQYTCESLE